MKIDVKTPDFCPDNCINCEIDVHTGWHPCKRNYPKHRWWTCKNEKECTRIYNFLSDNLYKCACPCNIQDVLSEILQYDNLNRNCRLMKGFMQNELNERKSEK